MVFLIVDNFSRLIGINNLQTFFYTEVLGKSVPLPRGMTEAYSTAWGEENIGSDVLECWKFHTQVYFCLAIKFKMFRYVPILE
jgi:hypothetical protein